MRAPAAGSPEPDRTPWQWLSRRPPHGNDAVPQERPRRSRDVSVVPDGACPASKTERVREEPALLRLLQLGYRLKPGGSGPGAARAAVDEGGGNTAAVCD